MPLASVDLADCPLIRDPDLLGGFNAVAATFNRLETEFPTLKDKLHERLPDLLALRDRLTRKAYRVGFLGTTGAGKSTTFNNVLKVSAVDAPAQPGKGLATTSAVTCLRRSPVAENRFFLNYLSREEYNTKRTELCEALGVNPNLSDDEVKVEIARKGQNISQGEEVTLRDVQSLRLLIDSRHRLGEKYVKPEGHRESAPYGDRGSWVNHAPEGHAPEPEPRYLLRDADIEFVTDVIPKELEMIDLPGLGSQGVVDTVLTLSYLKKLDGALVFFRFDQLADANNEKILARMRRHNEGRLAGRIWAIFTKFDGATTHHFPEGKACWFDDMRSLISRHTIRPDHVSLVSNKVYDAIEGGEQLGTPQQIAAAALGRRREFPRFAEYPEFTAAIDDLYEDGGIGGLRDLVVKTLAEEVGAEIREQAAQRLKFFERFLKDAEDLEKRRSKQSDEEFEKAHQCKTEVTKLLNELRRKPAYFDPPMAKVRAALGDALKKVTAADIVDAYSPDEKARELEIAASSLDKAFRRAFDADLVDPVYAHVGKQLENLPAVPVGGAGSASEAWQQASDADRKREAWSHLPQFLDKTYVQGLREQDALGSDFGGADFHAVLKRKASLAVNEAVHAVRMRLQYRLGLISRDLAFLIERPLSAEE